MKVTPKKLILGFFLLFFCLRLLSVLFMIGSGIDVSPIQDPLEYKQLGINLVLGNGFSISPAEPYVPDLLRGPVYPLFLGATYLFDQTGYLAIILQQFFLIFVGYLLFRLFLEYTSKKIAFLGTSFFYLELQFWMLSLQTMSETLYTLLVFSSFFVLFFYQQKKELRYKHIIVAGILTGLALFTRPAGILVIPWLVLIIVWEKERRWQYLSCFALIIFLISVPWLSRNYSLTNQLFFSASPDYNIIIGFGDSEDVGSIQQGDSMFDNKGRQGTVIAGFNVEGHSQLKEVSQAVKDRHGLGDFVSKQIGCAPKVWFDGRYPTIISMAGLGVISSEYFNVIKGVDIAIWSIFLILCLFGIFVLFKKRDWLSMFAINGLIWSTVFLNVCVSYTRMRIPIMPLILFLSGVGLHFLITKFGKAKR